jgi:hypothetical protein
MTECAVREELGELLSPSQVGTSHLRLWPNTFKWVVPRPVARTCFVGLLPCLRRSCKRRYRGRESIAQYAKPLIYSLQKLTEYILYTNMSL